DEHLATRDETPRAVFLAGRTARAVLEREEDAVFLGEFEETICFALDIPADLDTQPLLTGEVAFQSLRGLATRLPGDEAGLLAYARALLLWHRSHQYCAQCGSPSVAREGGHVRMCTNAAC